MPLVWPWKANAVTRTQTEVDGQIRSTTTLVANWVPLTLAVQTQVASVSLSDFYSRWSWLWHVKCQVLSECSEFFSLCLHFFSSIRTIFMKTGLNVVRISRWSLSIPLKSRLHRTSMTMGAFTFFREGGIKNIIASLWGSGQRSAQSLSRLFQLSERKRRMRGRGTKAAEGEVGQ